ncbi:potassium channel family protein [Aquihabitans daechungensis]|uniref:potassium channel family protein n=1 Tax=Aquihabitans daechungensis TaxID=1052257 RepID=UPI003B9FB8E6
MTSRRLVVDPHGTRSDEVVDPRLRQWERRMNPVIILAALVPIVVGLAPKTKGDPFVVLNVVSWLIFLADLLVHLRFKPRYLRTALGQFDLFIVVLTFPWYLIPGLGNAAFLGLARLGRLIRLIWSSGTPRLIMRLVERIGKAALYSAGLIFVCSEVVLRVEPASSGFATQGDAIWWGFVTFTTVGYGDLVPVSATGRFVAVVLMVGGVALIGLLAGSLAEFLADSDQEEALLAGDADDPEGTDELAVELILLREVRALRAELAELRAEVAAPDP